MNLKLSAAGFALQSAKGAAKAQPSWWGPVGGGGLVSFELEQTEDELTSATVGAIGEYRAAVAIAADYESRMWPASIGALLYAVLGDIQTSKGTPAVKAVLTTALAGVNNDLTFLAKTAGAAGNNITVALVDPAGNDQKLAVTVTDSAIEVSLATGPAGAITSTAREVRDAVNTDSEAAALVAASLAPGNDGSGVVTALAATNLAGGTDGAYGAMYLNPEAWGVVAGRDKLVGSIGVGDRAGLVGSPLGGLKVILGNLWATGGGIYQNKQMEPGDLHPPSLSMIRTLALSVADNTITYVTMRQDAAVEWDTHGFWDGEVNNAGPVIGMQGIYLIEVAVEWAAKASGWREVGIAINGSVLVYNRTISPGNILCPMTISAMAELKPSDLVQIEVRHGGTGAALQLNAKTHTPRLQLTWLRHRPGYGIATNPYMADPWPGEHV